MSDIAIKAHPNYLSAYASIWRADLQIAYSFLTRKDFSHALYLFRFSTYSEHFQWITGCVHKEVCMLRGDAR